MKKILSIAFLITMLQAGAQPLSQQLAKTAMTIWPDSFVLENDKFAKWRYDQGVILKGIEGIWYATGDASWYNYIQKSMDFYVQGDGSIKGYKKSEFNIDHINNGKLLLLLYRITGKEKYYKAAHLLRNQLKEHPRTSEGGFWHKNIYPNQMWLDGLYMAQPFYAEYANLFSEDTAFNDITRQFVLMEKHSRDAKTGLLYHGWDESREQQWADKTTGLSPNFWGRALGWFGMAMVDALDYFPENHPGRSSIIQILNRFAKAVTDVQDKNSGLWYDVPNLPNEPKNYVEASASSMLVYTLAKGVRKNYLPASYLQNAQKGYDGIVKQFIKTEGGRVNLHGTVAVSGLGGKPYRDGSFEYYMSEPVVVNDPKGVGAFIKAAVEMEMVPLQSAGKGKTVVLDYYFNNERKKDLSGRNVRYHYTWEDKSNGGFSLLGNVFEQHGANITSLESAPTSTNLQKASVYIIVDPDTEKETEKPNYIQPTHITAITEWVKNGGMLVLMSNDAGNAEFKNFNQLAAKFGIQFNEDNFNLVKDNQFEQGAVVIPSGHSIFKTARKLFIKELATLDVKPPAKTILLKENKAIAAVADYGKGKVIAIGDPWLYNEYVDGRKLPADFDNYKAATDLVKFLLNPSGKPLAVSNSAKSEIIVDPSGNGDYKSIQAAINSLADAAHHPRVIQIKNGVYNEKLYIEKHNIIFRGESREGVVITQAIARDEWRCGHADDWGVATVNVDGDDISLENLTIINSFGFDLTENKTIDCKSDSTGKKVLAKNGHQMALRTINGTRLRAVNCHFKSYGGDTVSPWDVETGMFYFKDCIMEGSVDLYCPRGWAWAQNCHFIVHSGSAAIWHDGSKHQDSKTVLMNCSFEGFDGFNLGRFHRDAQFYIINSKFPQNMADKDIYLVSTANEIKWGKRVYYYNSHRTGGNYPWHTNNLHTAPGAPKAEDITVQWLFKNKWNPEHATEARAYAVLKKLNSNSATYGAALAKEKMPAKHPANDFTKQAIPYYKTEGPAWENDKLGFRLYLDVRNAKDIFGKTTTASVMDTVGTFGDKYYHYFDPSWGMDILKVGTSLGAGALAIKIKAANKKDTIIRLGGTSVGETSYELVKNGPDTAIIKLHYKNWKVLNRTYHLIEEISINKGSYYYESKVTMKGLKGDEKFVTGIVNLKSNDYKVIKEDNHWILYTHGIQSENNDHLGMAVMVNAVVSPEAGETPKEGKGITSTYTVSMNIKNNQPVVFRFYAGWEQTDNGFKNENYFRTMLLQEAAKWNNDKTIMARK